MQAKLKLCAGCNQMKHIWKNDAGTRYCQSCWAQRKPTQPKPASRINPVSDKKKALDKAYSLIRQEYLQRPENRCCAAKLTSQCMGCTPGSMTVHHRKGRGEYLLKTESWVSLCLPCHQYVEQHPQEAKSLGLSEDRLSNV